MKLFGIGTTREVELIHLSDEVPGQNAEHDTLSSDLVE
jgi:hypothetical protein